MVNNIQHNFSIKNNIGTKTYNHYNNSIKLNVLYKNHAINTI